MTEEQLKTFLEKVNDDGALQAKLKEADMDQVVAIAKEAGFEIRKADMLPSQAKMMGELTDDELEQRIGGAATNARACP